jgi:hypothetical protein
MGDKNKVFFFCTMQDIPQVLDKTALSPAAQHTDDPSAPRHP